MIRFDYQPFLVKGSRSGRFETLYRPIIPIQIFGPAGIDEDQGLVDTGSDDTLFPDHLISKLGVVIAPNDHAAIAGIEGSLMLVATVTSTWRSRDQAAGMAGRPGSGSTLANGSSWAWAASSNTSPPASTVGRGGSR